MPENEKKAESSCCRHGGGCSCAEAKIDRNGEKFCSEACANDAKSGSKCSCGHPGCTMK